MRLLVACLLVLIPIWHQVRGHNLHLRILSWVRPATVIPITPHELRYRAGSFGRRNVIDAAWLAYMIGATLLIYFFLMG